MTDLEEQHRCETEEEADWSSRVQRHYAKEFSIHCEFRSKKVGLRFQMRMFLSQEEAIQYFMRKFPGSGLIP